MLKTAAAAAALTLAAASAHAEIKTVFVIALENHNFTQPASLGSPNQIFGNPAAPYINSLITPGDPNAAQVSYASNYQNVGVGVHPSEPNYVWAEAGVHGPLNDAQPYPANIVSAPSLSAALQANGVSWKSYQEGIDHVLNASGKLTDAVLPSNQWTVPYANFSGTSSDYTNPFNGSHQYNYAAKHNPQVFFTATNGGTNTTPDTSTSNPEAKYYAPLEQLSTDLNNNTVARYNWITPDQFNDMHTALTGGFTYNGVHYTGDEAQIAQGDNFLSIIVPMIMASQAYKNDGAIVIWNDETEGGDSSAYTSTEIVISPLAKGNAYTNDIKYTHSSDLRFMQELFGVDPSHGQAWLGDAANATDLSDLFLPTAVPEPSTWAMLILGVGLVGAAQRRRVKAVAA